MNFDKYTEHKAFPITILILLGLVWGSSFILIKRGLVAFDPLQVGTIRIMFASLVMIPIAFKNLRLHFKTDWKKFVAVGLIGNFFPAILFAYAETGITSSLAGILNALTPMFTLIFGTLFFAAQINRWQMIGLIIGFGGSVALSFLGSEGTLGSFNHYAGAVIIATLGYGLNINLLKKWFPRLNSLVLTSLAMFSVGPLAAVYLLSTNFVNVVANNDEALMSLFYLFLLGVVGTSFALVLFNKLIQITTPVFASTVTYLIPIAAVIWGVIDNEAFYPVHFIGMAMIIMGVYIVNKNK
ncbi:permease of the drug/metabolite transporter (dmt) superfamily [hydrocarbon metagenome]|uniref:Permease of the drug/metabolite transporter (Dmt) superfamily n=1 Tax=hydrocarbon metagenome TaxID=938273 RepID=A0A0W8G1M8_9ZZZZ